jgi:hypothetical protein
MRKNGSSWRENWREEPTRPPRRLLLPPLLVARTVKPKVVQAVASRLLLELHHVHQQHPRCLTYFDMIFVRFSPR